jgi:hypothetical protein
MLSPAASATDATGEALCLNVLPGSVTVTETPSGAAAPVGQVDTFVRAQTITSVTLMPSPM